MKTGSLSSALLVKKGMAGPTGADTSAREPVWGTGKPGAPGPRTLSVRQQAEALHQAFAAAPARSHRVNLSFRMDSQRHHRLKLAAAHTHRSAQDILTAALDQYLDQMAGAYMDGTCNCLSGASDTDHPRAAPSGLSGAPAKG